MNDMTRIKNKNGQYSIRSSLLLLFSTPFIVWQMGILYYSGTTLSLFGRTPIPLANNNTTLVIVLGYLASILMICLIPRKTIWMERILLPIAFLATLFMLLPLSSAMITALFYIAVFCCVFSIGTMVSIAAQHFTVETTWRDGMISMMGGGMLIAVLQNDFFRINFTTFTIFSILLIAAQIAFYYSIPSKIDVAYVNHEHPMKMPKILFIGIWLISGVSTLLICFASSFAESVSGGISTLYFSAAIMALFLTIIKKQLASNSIRIYSGFLAIAVFGFVLTLLSLYVPELRYIACIFLGFIVVLANLWIFFAAVSFQVYPTRYIGAIGAAMGLVLAVFHSILLEALRANLPLLYGIYATLSVALLLIYFFMEPYLIQM